MELVMTNCGAAGGLRIVPTPLSWSDITRFDAFAPPLLVAVMV